LGDEQFRNEPPSSEHLKVTPSSLLTKVNVAVLELLRGGGPSVILTSGTTVSTVQSQVTGADSFPASSIAVAARSCAPSCRSSYVVHRVQASAGAPSREQVNEPFSPSVESSWKVAEVS
jgi:hypothetical protein